MSNENVTRFINRKDGEDQFDPFGQAEENERTDPLSAVAHEPEHEPEPELVEPPKQIKKPARRKTGSGLAITAIGLSAIAIAVSGYSVLMQKGNYQVVTEQAGSLETYLTEVRQQTEGMIKQVSLNTKGIAANHQQLQTVTDLRNEILVYGSATEQIKSEMLNMQGTVVNSATMLGEQRTAIEVLTGRVGTLEDRPVQTVTRLVRKAAKPPARKAEDKTKLEGASLASVDVWGAQTNVMLRDSSGSWIPLSQGDYYRGWKLVSAKGNQVTFSNGRRSKTIRVEG